MSIFRSLLLTHLTIAVSSFAAQISIPGSSVLTEKHTVFKEAETEMFSTDRELEKDIAAGKTEGMRKRILEARARARAYADAKFSYYLAMQNAYGLENPELAKPGVSAKDIDEQKKALEKRRDQLQADIDDLDARLSKMAPGVLRVEVEKERDALFQVRTAVTDQAFELSRGTESAAKLEESRARLKEANKKTAALFADQVKRAKLGQELYPAYYNTLLAEQVEKENAAGGPSLFVGSWVYPRPGSIPVKDVEAQNVRLELSLQAGALKGVYRAKYLAGELQVPVTAITSSGGMIQITGPSVDGSTIAIQCKMVGDLLGVVSKGKLQGVQFGREATDAAPQNSAASAAHRPTLAGQMPSPTSAWSPREMAGTWSYFGSRDSSDDPELIEVTIAEDGLSGRIRAKYSFIKADVRVVKTPAFDFRATVSAIDVNVVNWLSDHASGTAMLLPSQTGESQLSWTIRGDDWQFPKYEFKLWKRNK